MIAGLKSEFRKLFTVRSTYILMALALAYMILFDFYVVGWKSGAHTMIVGGLHNPQFLMIGVTRAGGIVAPVLFSSIIAVLLMAHEYRYSTIMYTLTSSNSRSKTLLAKIITVTTFSVIFSVLLMVLAPLLVLLGIHTHHLKLANQVFFYREFFLRVLFYGWAYPMIGVVLAIFFRNIIASVLALFLLPVTIEPLIALLLNNNQQQYLPFTALVGVLNNGLINLGPGTISSARSAVTVMVYLIIAWIVAWYIFLKRDAG
jgi:ABC-type transport system involved in multi-copper enzyme maturation permease subunit